MVMGFNDIENIAHNLVSADFSEYGLFEPMTVCKELTISDINERLKSVLCDEYTVLSVVKPIS